MLWFLINPTYDRNNVDLKSYLTKFTDIATFVVIPTSTVHVRGRNILIECSQNIGLHNRFPDMCVYAMETMDLDNYLFTPTEVSI